MHMRDWDSISVGKSSKHKQYDLFWMQKALEQAHLGAMADEVPVGAVLIQNNQLIGAAYNQPIGQCDPSAHAEILAMRKGAMYAGNYRLPESTLYCTLEPCAMCVGAMIHARIQRLVFAAKEPKSGAIISQCNLASTYYNHRIDYTYGVLAEAAQHMLKQFFLKKRKNKFPLRHNYHTKSNFK